MAEGFCPHCSYPVAAGATACPHCGRPLAGAPGGRSTKVIVAVVLGAGCVLALLLVGGIVAALVIPNFLEARERARQQRTLADMRQLAAALESYNAQEGVYPGGDTLAEVAKKLGAHGWPDGRTTDGWGHEMRWSCWEPEGEGCASYELVSPGRDGELTPDEDGGYAERPFEPREYDADIVLNDGLFTRWPEGEGRFGPGG